MRSVNLLSPTRLRITTDRVTVEYRLEVWTISNTHRVIELTRTDVPTTYRVVVPVKSPRQQRWTCNCPASQHKAGQCKHVLALKAGLRSVGCKV